MLNDGAVPGILFMLFSIFVRTHTIVIIDLLFSSRVIFLNWASAGLNRTRD
jgi:hypothetical protein